MKIIDSVRVHRDDLPKLRKLKYLQRIDVSEDEKEIRCRLRITAQGAA